MIVKQLRQISIAAMFSVSAISAFAVEEGEQAPAFSLPSIHSGQPAISLAGLAGKSVFVDFWASWCAPCLRSLPLYEAMQDKYEDQGLVVVAVNVDNPIEDGLDFLIDTPLDFLIPSDPDGEAAELFEVIGMPTSYLIDADGTVSMVHMGFRDGDMEIIEAAVEKSLAAH